MSTLDDYVDETEHGWVPVHPMLGVDWHEIEMACVDAPARTPRGGPQWVWMPIKAQVIEAFQKAK